MNDKYIIKLITVVHNTFIFAINNKIIKNYVLSIFHSLEHDDPDCSE